VAVIRSRLISASVISSFHWLLIADVSQTFTYQANRGCTLDPQHKWDQ
jgi:hypothetical protein